MLREQGRSLTEVLAHHGVTEMVETWEWLRPTVVHWLHFRTRALASHLIDTLLDYDKLLTVAIKNIYYTFLLRKQFFIKTPTSMFIQKFNHSEGQVSSILFLRYFLIEKSRQYFGKLKYFFWARSVKSTTDKLSNYSWQSSYTVTLLCHTISILIK